MSFFGFKGTYLRFSRKRQDGSAPNFVSGFRRKHLFIRVMQAPSSVQKMQYFFLSVTFGE